MSYQPLNVQDSGFKDVDRPRKSKAGDETAYNGQLISSYFILGYLGPSLGVLAEKQDPASPSSRS